MQPHRHTTIGIPCMNKVPRHIKVLLDDTRKDIVRLLIGRVRPPIREGQHLRLGNIVCEQGRVMPLHRQLIPVTLRHDMRLHPIPHEYIPHLGL